MNILEILFLIFISNILCFALCFLISVANYDPKQEKKEETEWTKRTILKFIGTFIFPVYTLSVLYNLLMWVKRGVNCTIIT